MESSGKSINRELPLFPSAPHTCSIPTIEEERSPQQHQQQQQQQHQQQQQQQQRLTIFYNGKICVSDHVTELRARAIIMAASREMEERKRTPPPPPPRPPPPPPSSSLQSQFCGVSGVSMKRSLHRFLEKRKNRMAAMAPYRPH